MATAYITIPTRLEFEIEHYWSTPLFFTWKPVRNLDRTIEDININSAIIPHQKEKDQKRETLCPSL